MISIPDNLLAISFLSAFEALLVDLALASPEEAEAWLTFPEAEALFAAEAKSARRELERTAKVSARGLALLVGVLSLAAGAVAWLGLTDLHWRHGVVASLAVLATALGLAAALVANRGDLPEKLAESLGIGLVTIAGLAALEALNEHRTKPFISDNVGLIAGVLITAAAVAAWLSRKQSRLSEPRA
jgi:Kef-type K+ transport system membrane component KefB